MKIYHYHPGTKELLSWSEARLDPAEAALGNEKYLVPAYATTIAPPETEEHEVAVWNGSGWSVMADCRGAESYDSETGERKIISEIGVIPTVTTPPPVDFRAPRWTGEAWVDDNPLTYAELREQEYNRRGVTVQALVVALVEAEVEIRPEAIASLQAIREEVKALYPKE